MHEYILKVKPVLLPIGSLNLGEWILREFQENVHKYVNNGGDILLTAPVGAGKTLTLLLSNYYDGAVGVYPNNTLLLDQQRSINRILTKALKAEPLESPCYKVELDGKEVDVLKVYKLPEDLDLGVLKGYREVSVVLLSGKYITYEKGGELKPKRTIIEDHILKHLRKFKKNYTITLTTPDTLLLILSGAYRNLEKVGMFLHNLLLGSIRDESLSWISSKTGVGTKSVLEEIQDIAHYLLKYPLFIDEFHLYGKFEIDALIAILDAYRNYLGWEEPIILSSATPSETVVEELKRIGLNFEKIEAKSGKDGDLIRGLTELHVLLVDIVGRGISGWFRLGDEVPRILKREDIISELRRVSRKNLNAIIVVDRLNQLPDIVNELRRLGFRVSCEATIKPIGCEELENGILVGSEAISQGIDRENVVFGISVGYYWGKVLQRIGRIGRRTSSIIYLLALDTEKVNEKLERVEDKKLSYEELVSLIGEVYPNYNPVEYSPERYYTDMFDVRRRILTYSTLAFKYKAGGVESGMEELKRLLTKEASVLDKVYGSPDILARLLLFRSSGFPVVAKIGRKEYETDIGTVLRNFKIVDIYVVNGRTVLEIELEKARSILCLKHTGKFEADYLPKGGVEYMLNNRITTLGVLMEFGYELYAIESKENEYGKVREIKIPISQEGREQTVLIFSPSPRLTEYLTYTISGAKIEDFPFFALFI